MSDGSRGTGPTQLRPACQSDMSCAGLHLPQRAEVERAAASKPLHAQPVNLLRCSMLPGRCMRRVPMSPEAADASLSAAATISHGTHCQYQPLLLLHVPLLHRAVDHAASVQ